MLPKNVEFVLSLDPEPLCALSVLQESFFLLGYFDAIGVLRRHLGISLGLPRQVNAIVITLAKRVFLG